MTAAQMTPTLVMTTFVVTGLVAVIMPSLMVAAETFAVSLPDFNDAGALGSGLLDRSSERHARQGGGRHQRGKNKSR